MKKDASGAARRPVGIVRDGGATWTLYFDEIRDGSIRLATLERGDATTRYAFDEHTGEATDAELTTEIVERVALGKPRGDTRQLTMFDAPALIQVTRAKTRRVALWRIAAEDLQRIKGER